jgi:hypothetical protein
MSFDPRQVEARLSLGIVLPEEMPPIAWDALEAGYDGLAIRRMAAFDNPTGFETDLVLPKFMEEIGLKRISKAEAARALVYAKAREILDTRQNPLHFCSAYYRLWISSEYSAELCELGNLDDAAAWLDSAEHEAYARDCLIEFTRSYQGLKCSDPKA